MVNLKGSSKFFVQLNERKIGKISPLFHRRRVTCNLVGCSCCRKGVILSSSRRCHFNFLDHFSTAVVALALCSFVVQCGEPFSIGIWWCILSNTLWVWFMFWRPQFKASSLPFNELLKGILSLLSLSWAHLHQSQLGQIL